MSRGTVVAKRYARALFDLAREQDAVASTENELKLVADAIEANADLRVFLSAPNITLDKKIALLRGTFGGKVSQFVLNTVSLLVERGRETEIPAVLEAYMSVAGGVLGRADALVTSAKPLTPDQAEDIAKQFAAIIGKNVRVIGQVDESLIGGMTVRIGDTLYDGSLRGKLNRLSKELQTSL